MGESVKLYKRDYRWIYVCWSIARRQHVYQYIKKQNFQSVKNVKYHSYGVCVIIDFRKDSEAITDEQKWLEKHIHTSGKSISATEIMERTRIMENCTNCGCIITDPIWRSCPNCSASFPRGKEEIFFKENSNMPTEAMEGVKMEEYINMVSKSTERSIIRELDSESKIIDMEPKELDEDTETNLAIPGLEPMQKHIKILSKRKELKEAQMVGLAKELFILSAYKSDKHILVENCKFSVGLDIGNDFGEELVSKAALSITLYLKKTTKKDKDKTTWRNLVPQWLEKSIVVSKDNNKVVATFSIDKHWNVTQKDMSNKFLKLLPTGRLLVREELSIQESEALADIAYLESMDEMAEEIVNG